jgi:hypothetical protein
MYKPASVGSVLAPSLVTGIFGDYFPLLDNFGLIDMTCKRSFANDLYFNIVAFLLRRFFLWLCAHVLFFPGGRWFVKLHDKLIYISSPFPSFWPQMLTRQRVHYLPISDMPLFRITQASRVTPGMGALSILMVRTGSGQMILKLCGGL